MQDLQPSTADTLSKRGFAELIGVSPGRVSQMIAAGLPVETNGRIDIEKGKAWVASNIDPSRRRIRGAADAAAAASGARASRDVAEAEIARLKADRLAENLIDKQATLRTIEARARFERDAWIGWVNRAAPDIAAETGANVTALVALLDKLVREQLSHLARTPLDGLDT